MRILSISFWMGSLVSLIMGFYKMFVYTNYDSSEYPTLAQDNVNAYVGGDAYNYIINGTYTIAYFTLFGALLLGGFIVEILRVIKIKQTEKTTIEG